MSDMLNCDLESFPYLATRRERKLFYDENKMAAICHDTDIEDDYKVTGVTSNGNFVYRGGYIFCEDKLAGNTAMCEYLGDYVFFPRQQVLTSSQAYEGRVDEITCFQQKTEAAVDFYNMDTTSQNYGRFYIEGSRGGFDTSHSKWMYIFSDAMSKGKLSEGMCFVPVFKSYYGSSKIMTEALSAPADIYLRINYIEIEEDVYYGFSGTFYDINGNEFDYEAWLLAHWDEYSAYDKFGGNAVFDGSGVQLNLGYFGNGNTRWVTELQLDYISQPTMMGATYGNRLFACDALGVDIYYSSATDKYDFMPGTSLGDAGVVSCADHGKWTGLISYGGTLYAFKKNGMYRIYSSDGLSFYMDKVCDVGAVSQKAVCVVSDVMYFLSETGLYRFTGTYPEELSDNLGRRYKDGVLGGYDNKLYASLEYSEGRELVIYDAQVSAFGVHDDFDAVNFVTYGGKLYGLNSADGYVYEMAGERKPCEFSIITRKFFLGFDKKAINGIRLYFDFSGGENEKIEVLVSYDNGEWEPCFKPITSGRLKYVPIKFKKCDELAVKIKGNGIFTLKGMTLSFYSGGDIKQNK